MQKAASEPLFVLCTALRFGNYSVQHFEWPFTKRPLDITADELFAVDLFGLNILETMLDRELTTSFAFAHP